MKGGAFALAQMKLTLHGIGIAGIADNAASAPLTSLYLALHTADPGRGGSQITAEVAYPGYARVPVARSTAGFTVSSDPTQPYFTLAAVQSFPICGVGGAASAKFFSLGTASSGTGVVLYRGVIGPYGLPAFLGPFSATAAGTLTVPGLSGLAVDDQVIALGVDGSSLPTGLADGTTYYVKTVSGDSVALAATKGGAALTFSAAGDGVLYHSVPNDISAGTTPQLGTDTTVWDT